MTEMLLLALIVFIAYGIEAALGFGCTILAVTMAVHLFEIKVLLPVLVSLNLMLSAYIVLRHWDAVCWRLLLGRILPLMIVGLPAGMLLLSWGDGPYLKLGFGIFVVLLSAVELWRSRARASAASHPLTFWRAAAVLALGGVMHGLYASGGPMAVYFTSREPLDKRQFRSTLTLLWLLLNGILIAVYLYRGLVTVETARMSAILLVPLVAGIAAGEWFHGRVKEHTFRRLVFSLLLFGGLVLVAGHVG